MRRLLHWLLCHTVIVTLLLFVIVAILLRGPIFGIKDTPADITESTAVTDPQANAGSRSQSGTEQAANDADDDKMPAALQQILVREPTQPPELIVPPVSADTAKEAAEQAVDEPASVVAGPAVEQAGENATMLPPEPVAELMQAPGVDAESIPAAEEVEPQSPAPQADTDRQPAVSAIPDTGFERDGGFQFRSPQADDSAAEPQLSSDELLQQARRAYWNDDLEKAKLLYQDYINSNPDNPDGYGELGNLLSTQGDLTTAAEMYRLAADLLMQQGKQEQAEQLKQVLNSIEVIQNSPE